MNRYQVLSRLSITKFFVRWSFKAQSVTCLKQKNNLKISPSVVSPGLSPHSSKTFTPPQWDRGRSRWGWGTRWACPCAPSQSSRKGLPDPTIIMQNKLPGIRPEFFKGSIHTLKNSRARKVGHLTNPLRDYSKQRQPISFVFWSILPYMTLFGT